MRQSQASIILTERRFCCPRHANSATMAAVDLNRAPKAKSPVQHQSSIHSFFQPRDQRYSAPPASLPTNSSDLNASPDVLTSPLNPASQPVLKLLGDASQLPQHTTICQIEPEHIQPLKRINSLLLPMNYPDNFYDAILTTNFTFSRAILWTQPDVKVVGGIVCRLDPALAPESTQKNIIPIPGIYDIYIQSLALLSPYRENGIASQALESVIKAATEQKDKTVRDIYAHVWTENREGLEWYAARGFKRDEQVIHGYYRRLRPDTAWIVRKKISMLDHLPAAHTPPPTGLCTTRTPTEGRPGVQHTQSFQDRRPDMEWNDLPEDVLKSSLLRAGGIASGNVSTASSRSSSRSGIDGKGKKKRQYPAAAFGS